MEFCPYITIYDQFCLKTPLKQLPSSENFYNNLGRYLGIPNTISGPARDELNRRSNCEIGLYKNKSPTYKLYPRMAHALLHTNLNIPCNEVRLPFQALQINLGPDAVFLENGKELCSILIYLAEGNVSGNYYKNLYVFYQVKDRYAKANVDGVDVSPYYFNFSLTGEETIEDNLSGFFSHPFPAESVSSADTATVVKLILGVSFLAISKNRKYVQRARVKLHNKTHCFCGSGKRYKDCCKKRNKSPLTYKVGRDIVLAKEAPHRLSIQEEGVGASLNYGYIKSGHMRWQRYKLCFCGSDRPFGECCKKPGMWARKLIFIEPCIVRPDLPFKQQLTPRQVRHPRDGAEDCHRRNPRYGPLSEESPELVTEWDYEKNYPLTPDDVTRGSGKKVWWRCCKDHSWQARIGPRARGKGCPACAGYLRQTLAEANPELAAEWDYEKNYPLTPDDVTPGSGKKVWWRCCKDHSWQARIGPRARAGVGCPACAGRLRKTLAEANPELAAEWDYEKNYPLTPDDVTAGSGKKVWWRCCKDHSWQAHIFNRARGDRARRGRGCSKCYLGKRRISAMLSQASKVLRRFDDTSGLSDTGPRRPRKLRRYRQ
jgi:hypothetical protein